MSVTVRMWLKQVKASTKSTADTQEITLEATELNPETMRDLFALQGRLVIVEIAEPKDRKEAEG